MNSVQMLKPQNNESKEPQYLTYDAIDVVLVSRRGQATLAAIRPSFFHSQESNPAHLRKLTLQKELLSISDRLHFFEAQLRQHMFLIFTDH